MKLSRADVWTIILAVIALMTGLLVLLAGPWALMAFPLMVGVVLAIGAETVPTNERWVVEIFGAYDRILGPGLHFLVSGVELIRARQPTAEQHLDLRVDKTLTKDDVKIDLNTELFFVLRQDPDDPSVLNRAVYQATYGVELDVKGTPEGAIQHFAHATLRSIVGSQSFDWVTDNQQEINTRVIEEMQTGVEPWGQIIRRHLIKELLPQPEIAEALLAEVTAQKNKIKTQVDADAKQYKDIKESEAQKQARILAAEAKAQEEIQDARGEAEGIRLRGEVLKSPEGRAAAEYNLAEQAIAAATALAKTNNTVILPAGFADLASLLKAGKSILEAPLRAPGSTP